MRVDKSKWKYLPLSEVGTFFSGYTPKANEISNCGTIPYFKVAEMNLVGNERILSQTTLFVDSNRRLFPKGSIVFPKNGASVSTNKKRILGFESVVDLNTAGITVHESCVNTYIYYWLLNINFNDYIRRGAVPTLNIKDLKDTLIPLPKISIQQAIASELDAIQTMIDGYKAQIADLDVLGQSIFLEMFGDPVANPKGWNMYKLCDVCVVTSSKRIYQSELTKSGIPFYRISDFTQLIIGKMIVPELYISNEQFKELENKNLVPHAGDILITSRGTLGLCYIVKENDSFYFQDGMITWLQNIKKNLSPTFLSFLLGSTFVKEQMQKAKNGSTVAYLSISMIKGFDIIIPPLPLQHHFATQVEAIEKQKELFRQQLKDAETLMAERMQYYFS